MLKPEQIECIDMMLHTKLTHTAIAKKIGVCKQTISNWKKTDEFIDEYNRQMKQDIQSLAAKALQTQTRLLNAKSEMVRYMASKDILDRAGFKPEEKVELETKSKVVIVDDLDESTE